MTSPSPTSIQSMKEQIESLEANLECPVCLVLPRELPIPCCVSGHIVCRTCKEHVSNCPTCRQPMPENMTNSLAGALIEQTVKHKCKYNDQGCEVKMMLLDLKVHERKCPERTVLCPKEGCGAVVKLKEFDDHMTSSLKGSREPHFLIYSQFGIWRYVMELRDWDLPTEWTVCIELDNKNDIKVYADFKWYRPSKSFVLWLWMLEDRDGASNYSAKVTMKADNRTITVDGLLISSVENVPTIDKCEEQNGKYFWCIPLTVANYICEESYKGTYLMRRRLQAKVELKKTS